jgi:hypothetical protein
LFRTNRTKKFLEDLDKKHQLMHFINNRLKIWSIILLLCCFCSCTPIKQIDRKYCMIRSLPDKTTLSFFYLDSTYAGFSQSDIAGNFITKGKWTTHNDTLFLIPERISLIDSKEILSKNNDGKTIIKIIDVERKRPLEAVIIRVGDKIFQTKENGEVALIEISSKILQVEYFNLKQEISTDEILGKTIKINIDFKKLQTFDLSKTWLIKKGRIVPIEKGFSEFRKCKN